MLEHMAVIIEVDVERLVKVVVNVVKAKRNRAPLGKLCVIPGCTINGTKTGADGLGSSTGTSGSARPVLELNV